MLKNFIGTTPYHVNINSVHAFRKINFRSCHRLRNNENSRFMCVHTQVMPRTNCNHPTACGRVVATTQ